MVAVILVLARVDVPRSVTRAVDTVVLLFADEGLEVVFCDVGPVGALPCLILNFGAVCNIGEGREKF
jgi:hypothetical protein